MKINFLSTLFLSLIVLFSCSKEEEIPQKEELSATIATYSDVEFSFDDSARFYATTTGKMYSKEQLSDEAISKTIDLVGESNTAFIAFGGYTNTRAKATETSTSTKVQHTNIAMTAEQFDAIKDNTTLKDLVVKNDNESRLTSFRGVILFETVAGKKGAIKVKAINATRVLVDIKVMK